LCLDLILARCIGKRITMQRFFFNLRWWLPAPVRTIFCRENICGFPTYHPQ
jgi:hypothetical protein